MKLLKFSLSNLAKASQKVYVVKVLLILMNFCKFWSNIFFFWWEGTRHFFTFIIHSSFHQFSRRKKKLKNGHFWLPLHKSKLIFMPMMWTYKFLWIHNFKIQANCKDHVKFHIDLLIRNTSKLNLKNDFFRDFLVRTWFLRSMGAVAQNRLILQKFHLN